MKKRTIIIITSAILLTVFTILLIGISGIWDVATGFTVESISSSNEGVVSAVSFNPEDERQIGYEFLDEGKVVHIWNTQDDYFFDKNSGIQLTNHFQDYWSRNIFCVGYYSGEEWIKIKCADELESFDKDIQTDNQTYVNATLWKDFIYGTYNFRLGVNYYLGLNDRNLSITIYGKNIGIDIPFDLGFAWKVTDVNIPLNNTDDIILINNTDYLLNGTHNLIFKDMNEAYFKVYGSGKYLKVDWNKNLNYAVKMYGAGNQEDFYVMLLVNAGIFDSGIEKSTVFYWIDAGGTCSGTPRSCYDYYEEYYCEMCGCFWKPYTCSQTASPCSSHTTQGPCEECGCLWTPAGIDMQINIGDAWKDVAEMKINILSPGTGCTGAAVPCEEFMLEKSGPPCSGCIAQDGCYWDWEMGRCDGTAQQCNTYGTEATCEYPPGQCGCTWEVSGYVKTWKTVTQIKINIGDSWKTVWG